MEFLHLPVVAGLILHAGRLVRLLAFSSYRDFKGPGLKKDRILNVVREKDWILFLGAANVILTLLVAHHLPCQNEK
jgi:hypothetical protein